MQDLLGTTLTLLAACSLAAVVTAKLKTPALLGYIVVGAVLGPSVAAWILPVVVVCWRESEALVLKELPNVHVYKAAVAPALGLAEQVMQLGGVPVTAANGALSSMRNATTL